MRLAKYIISTFIIIRMLFCWELISLAQQKTSGEVKVLALDPQSEIRFAAPWTPSAVKYSNAQELIVMGPTEPMVEEKGREQLTQFPVARALITIEPRRSYADALERLEAIAASRDEPAEFIEIGGWPAVEVKFSELLPRRGAKGGEEAEAPFPDISVQRLITAIAADDKVVRFDVTVLPNAPQGLLEGAQELSRSARFAKQGNSGEVQEALQRMRAAESKRHSLRQQRQGAVPEEGSAIRGAAATRELGVPVAVQTGLGELEIAVSANANNVVIASNGGLSFSANRTATFAAGATGVFGLNDPSLARAASGNFYLGVIAFPTGTVPQLNVTGCTNAVSRSTDNGANFLLQGYSAQCPRAGANVCFPDQEHIAADAINAVAGGNDQLYAVWRNFTPVAPVANCSGIGGGIATASIACSQDNGSTWTAAAAIAGAGDFPRVAVGPAGDVYVVSLNANSVLLNRFTSCSNGLMPVAGFPVTIAILNGAVACPVPGLDRCNNGNTLSSPTVAPDPDTANPDHLFASFVESDGAGGERVMVKESTDRGLTFPTQKIMSNNLSARRFMSWSCSTRGRAWTGWYDRSAATKPGATNDFTDYFVVSSDGLGGNISNNSDPQCASGWPCSVRNPSVAPPGDSESCSMQPQLGGTCSITGNRCDFSQGCPPGQGVCNGGNGCPKYGDYNGITCADNYVVAAWSSATPPLWVMAPAPGINIYADAITVPPQLTVVKILEHPDIHSLRLFNLQIDGVTVQANSNGGSTGPRILGIGTHTVNETGGTGTSLGAFTRVIGGDCAADGTINLAPGDNRTCTITNYDNLGGCSFGSTCCERGEDTQGCRLCRQICP